MASSLLANILLLLSFLHFTTALADPNAAPASAHLTERQVPASPTWDELCADYEWTANMSTIGANGTYRTVLLQKSSTGTIYNARMMDAAIKRLPPMTANKDLNEECGNWTAIALKDAEANYTRGVVAQFTVEGLPVGIRSGPVVVYTGALIALLLSFVWVFS